MSNLDMLPGMSDLGIILGLFTGIWLLLVIGTYVWMALCLQIIAIGNFIVPGILAFSD